MSRFISIIKKGNIITVAIAHLKNEISDGLKIPAKYLEYIKLRLHIITVNRAATYPNIFIFILFFIGKYIFLKKNILNMNLILNLFVIA